MRASYAPLSSRNDLFEPDSPVSEKSGLLTPESSDDGEDYALHIQMRNAAIKARKRRRLLIFGVLSLFLFAFIRLAHSTFRCVFKSYETAEPIVFTFDEPQRLQIMEQIDNSKVHVRGTVFIKPAPKNQKPNFNITLVPFKVPHSSWKRYVNIKTAADRLEISADPSLRRPPFWKRTCLGIDIYVQVAKGSTLDDLTIRSINLQMNLENDLSVTVIDETLLSFTSGAIRSSPNALESRKTIIETINGGIFGSYNLLDELTFKATNGVIQVGVSPKEASKQKPAAAVLSASSFNGDIDIMVVMADLPDREYLTKVEATNGAIRGKYLHGSRTELENANGAIFATVVPYDASTGNVTYLTTFTTTGMMDISLQAPIKPAADRTTGLLKSDHKSTTGQITLKYPEEWKGAFEASSLTGNIAVHGKDVEIIDRSGNYVKGKKGDGDGQMEIQMITGSIDLTIGT